MNFSTSMNSFFPLICDHTQPLLWASWLPVFWTLHLIGWLSLHCLVVFFLEVWSVLSFGPFFSFVPTHLLCSKGQSLGCSPGQGNYHHCVVKLYVGEESEGEQCLLLHSLPVFSYFPCYPQSNWALLELIPRWVVCVHSRTLWVSPMNSLLWDWEFLLMPPHPRQVFLVRGFKALFPDTGTLGCMACLPPQLFLPVYLHTNVEPPGPPAAALPRVLSALAAHLRFSYWCGWMFLL